MQICDRICDRDGSVKWEGTKIQVRGGIWNGKGWNGEEIKGVQDKIGVFMTAIMSRKNKKGRTRKGREKEEKARKGREGEQQEGSKTK